MNVPRINQRLSYLSKPITNRGAYAPQKGIVMKYLQPIANAMGLRIQKASSDGYSGYRVLNRHGMSVGKFFESLDSVGEYLAGRVKEHRY